ncbi:hypothetical protein M408DRAFT_325952 [Serendipita vermifera MAFF 305830]|uniref:AAA+ ATPase domain-containing protein n=1 Tax=Serendipita vermifera MAFF 305830 TaxID=933852 RepID=A0A0C3BM68_SERVB|nr:hypothetical protein M408DRAFT_325952 [Serendipita vermifera MAFF 305830]
MNLVTQLLQPAWTMIQPVRVKQSSIISFQTVESSLPTRNYAAEVFQGAVPSIRHSELVKRSFRAPQTAQSILSTRSTRPQQYASCPSLVARRQIWTSAWNTVKRLTPERITNPVVYSRVVALEAEANAFPHNVSKQVTLWRAILDLDTSASYDRIINRWERLIEFAPNSQIIKSDAAFRLYLTALVKAGKSQSVMLAATRRDQVLQKASLTPQEAPEPEAAQEVEEVAPTQSVSHDIAEAVLADPAVRSIPNWAVGQLGTGKSSSQSAATGIGLGSGTKEQPLHVQVEQPKGSVAWQLGKTLLIVALYGFITLTVLGLVLENSGILKANTPVAEFEQQGGEPVKFSDVHGVEEAKEELLDIVEFLKNPTTFSTLGGRLPKGVLLEGPPGTGKTLLARAVAGEAGVPFFFASGSEFDEIFVGVGAKRIRELFAAARKKQPSIIFIDELDAVGGKRSPKDQQYMKQTLNQLLVELDGFKQSEGIIVIGATNFPQSLDKALVRPGRFDRKVVVPLPDVKGRLEILKHHMKGVTNDPGVDVSLLARVTMGFSGADLQNMVNQAAIQASKERSPAVMDKHYEWARDKMSLGAERRSAVIEESKKLATAYHEGGHALAALYTKGAMPLYKVTCMPRGHALGVTYQAPVDDRNSITFTEFIASMDVAMGGRAAEELIYGKENITSGASSDLENATHTARAMIRNWGFSDKIGRVVYKEEDAPMLSEQKKDDLESEVRRLVEESGTRAMDLVKNKEAELHLLAKALVEYETLTAEEVQDVIKGKPIRGGKPLAVYCR